MLSVILRFFVGLAKRMADLCPTDNFLIHHCCKYPETMLYRLTLCTLCLLFGQYATAQFSLTGALKKWHKVTLTFDGPQASETGDPNPFTDYRLDVTFTQGNRSFTVPGYFAADGDAANTGATSGNKWRVHFAPDVEGTWTFSVSFRTGDGVALSDNPNAGQATDFDGTTGSFDIGPTDKTGRDNRARGRLEYVGERYLRFAETGAYFLKIGADAPENLLAYEDFDNTPNNGGRRKSWQPHAQDWNNGDPTWGNGKGKEIIGAINYLAATGQNAFSFLTMNISGDDRNVFPYISDDADDRLRMDCSKLDQWEILFAHADKLGMYLHFKTQETENDQLLDGGALGPQRRLYYRELIARFSHHLALNWNIGEENTNTDQQRKDFATFFRDNDPYQHHIVIHTFPGQHNNVYSNLVGDQSDYTGASLQVGWSGVHRRTLQWINESAQTGKNWVVANDEQGNAQIGVPHDDYNGSPSQDDIRQAVLWGHLMAGGAGVEYYFGYSLPHSDLTCQDFRSRSNMWRYNRHAHQFFSNYVPFWEMTNRNDLIGNNNDSNDAFCLAKPGDTYVVYLGEGGTTDLNLESHSGPFTVRWFNPQNGEGPLTGSKTILSSTGNETGSGAWVEEEGIVVIEMESADNLPGNWKDAQDDLSSPNINSPGEASGNNFIVWEGGQSLGNTGNGLIVYPVRVNTPGTYRFEWRNQVGKGTNTTEHNDTWLKIEADAFYGEKNNGSSTVCPKGSDNSNDCSGKSPNGSGENGFFKVYSSGANNWSWSTRTSDNDAHPIYARFDAPGVYNIIISARSNHHVIDRMVLAKTDYPGDPRSLSLPESNRENSSGGGPGPLGVVSIGNPPNNPNQDWVALITVDEVSCPEAGTPCDDGDPSTFDDLADGNCGCAGSPCPPAGTACDDGNPETDNDVEDGLCNCQGTIPGGATDLWLEAECAEVGSNWSMTDDGKASNSMYVQPPNMTNLNNPPSVAADVVRFSFTLAEAGTYRFYTRTMTTSGDGNSFWVRVDGGNWTMWNQINGNDMMAEYQWDQVGVWNGGDNADPLDFNLSAGNHTIEFGRREPNVRLDKIFVSRTDEMPQGLGDSGTNCTVTSTNDPRQVADLRIFPNPVGEWLTVRWDGPLNLNAQARCRIVNGLGQELRTWSIQEANDLYQAIPVDDLPSGTYYLFVESTQVVYQGTFVKQ